MLRSLLSVILGSWANPPLYLADIHPVVHLPRVGLGRYRGTPWAFWWLMEDSEDWPWTAGRVEGQGLGNAALTGWRDLWEAACFARLVPSSHRWMDSGVGSVEVCRSCRYAETEVGLYLGGACSR